MAKIKEVLNIQRSYSTQVDLQEEYFNPERRNERMEHYKPIKAHRQAFEKITQGMWQQDNKRSYIISGSFGTGKSHLLMMIASYFSTPSSSPEMQQFFENYEQAEVEEKVDEPKAAQLKNLRNEGQYLVSICDYASLDFETNFLRAIKETLELKGIDLNNLNCAYKEAIKKINEWQKADDTYFIEKMESLLENEGSTWSIGSLIADLNAFDVDALSEFKTLYKQVTTTDFQYDKDNYVEVLIDLIKTPEIKNCFKGWIFLFDEFDYQVGEKRFHLEQFQRFLQMCSESLEGGFPIIFTATIHKSFLEYRSVYNATDFSTISDRFYEIKLESEGIEDIISAVVNPQKNSDIWEQEIAPQTTKMVQLANDTYKYHLFSWLRQPQIKNKIIENIYPMHPVATYALIKLASAAGSNNRTVITFFSDTQEDEGSYAKFINDNDVVKENGDLNLYTADMLFDYFSLSSNGENVTDVAKENLRNYEASLRELNRICQNEEADLSFSENIYRQILKIMAIYDIIGLANNQDLIAFGLDMTSHAQQASLENALTLATNKKIIYLNDTNNCYEFKRSDSKDISGLIRDYKAKPENLPDNYMIALQSIVGSDLAKKTKKKLYGGTLDPRKYNLQYLEDKRLEKIFCMLKDVEDSDFFADIHKNILSETDIKKSKDGAVIYVICETQDDIEKAIRLANNNIYSEIMVAIPNEPVKIYDDIFSLLAVCHFYEDSSDFSPQDIRTLKDQGQTYDSRISKRLEDMMDSRNYKAYAAYGELLEIGAYDVGAEKLLKKRYDGKRNTFKHDELNKVHEFKDNNLALREAGDLLLDLSQPISYHDNYGSDRGDIKYIKNVLLQNKVIYVSNHQGSIYYCEMNSNISDYQYTLPALYAMICEIQNSNGEDIAFQPFVKEIMSEYGQGYNAILLFLAIIKRYFSDAFSVRRDSTSVDTVNISSLGQLKSVVTSSDYVNSVMKFEEISEYEELYVQGLNRLFDGPKTGNLETLQQVINDWYAGLYPICKDPQLYSDKTAKNFIEVCNRLRNSTIREICFYDFKEAVGYDRDRMIYDDIIDDLLAKIKVQKEKVEEGFYIVQNNIVNGLSEIFNAPSNKMEDLENTFKTWKVHLDEAQRDVTNPLQDETSKPIAKAINSNSGFEDIILKEIPVGMKLGMVMSWTTDHTKEYLTLFENGKKHIEEDVYAVSTPIYNLQGKYIEEDETGKNKTIRFTGELIIYLDNGDGNNCYYITTDQSDPQSESTKRTTCIGQHKIVVNKDTLVKFCGEGENNKYSSIISLNCINEDTKYEAKPVLNQQFQRMESEGLSQEIDYKANIIIPVDSESLSLCVDSIINLMKEYHNVSKVDTLDGLKKVVAKLED